MRFLSVYSGIGAHDLGFQTAGIEIVGQIEWDAFCSAVLEKHWPGLPRWKDVCDATVDDVRTRCGRIDGITGGFSCTDLSVAGLQKGIGRETRSGLTWRNLFRLIRGLLPDWIVIENVPPLISGGYYDRIAAPLERIGYALWPVVVGAWAIGAPHRRNRVWIVGRRVDNATSPRCTREPRPETVEAIRDETRREQPAGPDCGVGLANAAISRSSRPRELSIGTSAKHAMLTSGSNGPAVGDTRISTSERHTRRLPEAQAGIGGAREHDGDLPVGLESASEGERQWIVADASRNGQLGQPATEWADGKRIGAGGNGSMADTSLRGLRTDGGARNSGRHAHERGEIRWPSRPGELQHDWEPERLVKFGLGRDVAGTPNGLVQLADRDDEKIARYQNKEALKALGNCNPPHVPELIGRWIMGANLPDSPCVRSGEG